MTVILGNSIFYLPKANGDYQPKPRDAAGSFQLSTSCGLPEIALQTKSQESQMNIVVSMNKRLQYQTRYMIVLSRGTPYFCTSIYHNTAHNSLAWHYIMVLTCHVLQNSTAVSEWICCRSSYSLHDLPMQVAGAVPGP